MRTLLLIFTVIVALLLVCSARNVFAHVKNNTNNTNQIINSIN